MENFKKRRVNNLILSVLIGLAGIIVLRIGVKLMAASAEHTHLIHEKAASFNRTEIVKNLEPRETEAIPNAAQSIIDKINESESLETNQNQESLFQLVWASNDLDYSASIKWGDLDGDGDLDLATGNSGADKVYLKVNGELQSEASWIS